MGVDQRQDDVRVPRSEQEVTELAEQFALGQVDAATYFRAIEFRAADMVEREAGKLSRRKLTHPLSAS